MKSDSPPDSCDDAETGEYSLEVISESEWLRAAIKSESFKFLADPSEDIYTLEDGIPYSKADR
jgi:hypothetical protein